VRKPEVRLTNPLRAAERDPFCEYLNLAADSLEAALRLLDGRALESHSVESGLPVLRLYVSHLERVSEVRGAAEAFGREAVSSTTLIAARLGLALAAASNPDTTLSESMRIAAGERFVDWGLKLAAEATRIHSIVDAQLHREEAQLANAGWIVRDLHGLPAPLARPSFSYVTGLAARFDHPELVCSAPTATAHPILQTLAEAIVERRMTLSPGEQLQGILQGFELRVGECPYAMRCAMLTDSTPGEAPVALEISL
jgi:Domain of unknown function (DUF4262)